ncbi:MAG: hybrid sensor histidine kinase/response regulator, partial [Longimicrobiales bacterium]
MPAPLRISLLYAAFGTAWILIGDLALWLQGGVTATALLMELGKGAVFVAVSALLLYVMIRREMVRRQQATAQLERVLATAPIGIVSVGPDDAIRGWNAAATRILGWSDTEVTGRPIAEVGIVPGHETGPAGASDIVVKSRDGAPVDIRMSSSAPDAGPDGARVIVFGDMRPQIEFEAALRRAHKMEAVGRLAGGIAHEFNNVLTVIIGHMVLLSERLDETDERRQHADEVLRSAERAASLTRQLLVFSGKHVTRNSSIDLSRMLIDMRAAITQIAGDRVGIEYELADDLWPVRCDTAQLHQLVLSLAVNAQEAMPDGGRLEFQTANTTIVEDPGTDPVPPGSYVLLRISDTGRGMSRDTLAHLFEPFFTTKEQGTGLGLATVYGIVQQSEGHVRVRSRPGHGSSFYIYLPHASAAAGSAAGPRATTGAALLIVEDDDAVRELTTRVLRRSGHEVITARNGYEALAVLRSGAAV